MCRKICCVLLLLLAGSLPVFGDGLLYRFEGDVLPYDPSAGWVIFQPCVGTCQESVENGHFVLRWPTPGGFNNYTLFIAQAPELPPPPPLWVEWSFSSNHPFTFLSFCDAGFRVRYATIAEGLRMNGDAAFAMSAGFGIQGLALGALHTFRFETTDGGNYAFFIDGNLFFEDVDFDQFDIFHWLQIEGMGGCVSDNIPNKVNEWDFVRYGRITYGEQIVATDPPQGNLDTFLYANLDRFTVTFDSPNYVFVDEITVEVIGPPNPSIPIVLATKRLDNSEPEIVEIILDRPLPLGATTRFTFDDGTATNIVEYTLGTPGVCCSGSVCTEGDESMCDNLFVPGTTCTNPQPCCISPGACQMLALVCCTASGGSIMNPPATCEGDADGDGVDSLCGDACPADPLKLSPGQCGCGLSDTTDSDADTILDCFDECPGVDDAVFAPGCVAAIPTASHWGLAVIALCLLCAAKLAFGLQRKTACC